MYFLNRKVSFLLKCAKITSIQGYVNIKTARLFCPVAIIVASKYKVLLNGSLLFKDRSWGTDNNCPSHYTAEVSQEQAGWWRGLHPSVSKDYRASAAHDIRTRATSSNLTRVWKWGWNVNWFVKRIIVISNYCNLTESKNKFIPWMSQSFPVLLPKCRIVYPSSLQKFHSF